MLRQNNEYLRNVERISYSFAVLNTDTLGYSNPSFMEHLERWRMILGPKADPEEDIPLDAESQHCLLNTEQAYRLCRHTPAKR